MHFGSRQCNARMERSIRRVFRRFMARATGHDGLPPRVIREVPTFVVALLRPVRGRATTARDQFRRDLANVQRRLETQLLPRHEGFDRLRGDAVSVPGRQSGWGPLRMAGIDPKPTFVDSFAVARMRQPSRIRFMQRESFENANLRLPHG
jgi:hypothetical protein